MEPYKFINLEQYLGKKLFEVAYKLIILIDKIYETLLCSL